MQRKIVTGIESELLKLESALDDAVLETLGCVRAAVALGAAAGTAQDRIGDALARLGEARRGVMGAHAVLAAIAREAGLDVHLTGPIDKPEEDGPRVAETRSAA